MRFTWIFLLLINFSSSSLWSAEVIKQKDRLGQDVELLVDNGLLLAEKVKRIDGTYERFFYTYDDQNRLIERIVDNGSSLDKDNLKGVTHRQFLEQSFNPDPKKGWFPEFIFRSDGFAPDFQNEPSGWTLTLFMSDGTVLRQEQYDNEGELVKTMPFFMKAKERERTPPPSGFFEWVWQSVVHLFNGWQRELTYVNDLPLLLEDTARSVFGKSHLFLAGFYPGTVESGVIGKKEVSPLIRVSGINGILNSRGDCMAWMKRISETHGNVKVHYVYFASDGWTQDIYKCLLAKSGVVLEAASELVEVWRALIEEMGGVESGGKILHYAHSLGGAHTDCARQLLTPEERAMLEIVTFGSPSLMQTNGCMKVTNFVSRRDGISYFDPIEYLQALWNPDSNVVFLGDWDGPPLIDHMTTNTNYSVQLEELGFEFQLEWCFSD